MLAAVIATMIGIQTAMLTCEPLETDKRCRYAPEWSALVAELRKIEI